jgi:hypothetical protein
MTSTEDTVVSELSDPFLTPEQNTHYYRSRATIVLVWELLRPVLVGVVLLSLAMATFVVSILLGSNLLICFANALIVCVILLFVFGWLLTRIRFWTWIPLRCSHCQRSLHKKIVPDVRVRGSVLYVCDHCHTYLKSNRWDY